MERKGAEYRLTPAARLDLEAIWVRSLQSWGVDRTERYFDELTAAFELLASHPRLAPACDHVREGFRRAQSGRHVIYFSIGDHGIDVIRVLHDRMEPMRHF